MSLRGGSASDRRSNFLRLSISVKDCFAALAMTSTGLVLIFSLFACATKQKGPEVARPWIPPSPLQSLAGFADVDIKTHGRSESFQAALLAQSPNLLRIQILDDLGQEQALLVANGREVMWKDRREGTQQIFPQDPKVLKKTLHLPVALEEFIARLLEGTSPKQYPTTNPGYQIVTDAVEATPAGPYPRQWTWIFRKPKATLVMVFSQLKLNPHLGAGKFVF
jgi:outer membrane lipoprotein-sorting protein